MKQPKVFYDGKIYDVSSVNWYKGGSLCCVTIFTPGQIEKVETLFSGDQKFEFLKDEK